MGNYSSDNIYLSSLEPKDVSLLWNALPDGAGFEVLESQSVTELRLKLQEIRAEIARNIPPPPVEHASLRPEELPEDDVFEHWRPGRSCWDRPVWVIQRHTHRTSEARAFAVSCRRLACRDCGPKRKMKWYKHIARNLRDGNEYLEVVEVRGDEWRTMLQRIRRQKGQYAKIMIGHRVGAHLEPVDADDPTTREDVDFVDASLKEQEGGGGASEAITTRVYMVFTTAHLGGEEIARDSVKYRLRNVLELAPFERGCVSVSRAWKLDPEGTPPSDWKTVKYRNGKLARMRASSNQRLQEVAKEVAELSGVQALWNHDSPEYAKYEFSIPRDWDDCQVAVFAERLKDKVTTRDPK